MTQSVTADPFPAEYPAEIAILDAWSHAASERAPAVHADVSGLECTRIRSRYLCWLLMAGAPVMAPMVRSMTICGASFEEDVELGGAALAFTLRFVGCDFARRVLLNDARIVGLEIVGGSLSELVADRLGATGSVAIRRPHRFDEGIFPRWSDAPRVERQLRLHGANIAGNLDLRGCRLLGNSTPRQDRIALAADGLKVGGNALLSDGFRARGEVRMNGCQIGRNLDLTGARLMNPEGRALSIEQGRISGGAFFCLPLHWPTYPYPSRFAALGTVRLTGARIDGPFDCTGGIFVAPVYAKAGTKKKAEAEGWRTRAIEGDGLVVGDGMRLADTARFCGEVHLVNSRITGDFDCAGGFFDHPGEDAIGADGIVVTGTTFFVSGVALKKQEGAYVESGREPARTSGTIRLPYGDFKQGLMFDSVKFVTSRRTPVNREVSAEEQRAGIQAAYATIGGRFLFQKADATKRAGKPKLVVEVNLRQAKASELDDDDESWKQVQVLRFEGFEYGAIRNLDAGQLAWRVQNLDRHYARSSADGAHFQPQPYLKLAQVMQQAGFDAAATEIRIRLERHRTAFGGFGWITQALRGIFGFTIHYGYHPFRVAYFLAAWLLLSTLAFEFARFDFIVPAKRTETQIKAAAGDLVDSAAGRYDLRFNAFFFALDSLVPIVDLRQRSHYFVQPPSLAPWREAMRRSIADPSQARHYMRDAMKHTLVPAFGIINPYLGWTLTTLFVVGISGLVRKS